MRRPIACYFGFLALLVIAHAHGAAASESGYPYKAYVTADNVQVRSGPGDNYYATDKLKTGDEVEVYRNDPGGWLAIRPPRGSFSWIRTHSAQIARDGLAVTSEDRVAVRVGSNLSDTRDVIQVRLHRGEAIELIDPPRGGAPANAENSPWYKISPPSGEFRWVSARFVDASFPKDGLGRSAPRSTSSDLVGRGSNAASSAPVTASGPPTDAFQRRLAAIDLELSAIVAEPTPTWDFADLRDRTQALFDQASSPLERGRTRAVIERIAKFDDIRRRETSLEAKKAAIPASTTPNASAVAPSTLGLSQAGGRYDAEGQLARVPEPRPGGPQYAVLDASGNVRCYVSPAPGVNLRSYVGHQVGITGVRGYMPEQKATHIMARHVSLVEGAVTR